jgi:hypothetical protein
LSLSSRAVVSIANSTIFNNTGSGENLSAYKQQAKIRFYFIVGVILFESTLNVVNCILTNNSGPSGAGGRKFFNHLPYHFDFTFRDLRIILF